MLKANWPFLVMLGLLVMYFRGHQPRTVWPETIVLWAWLPYVAHAVLHNFVDGFQNTTRNVARITLIRTTGRDYDPRRVAPIQMALVPPFMTPVTLAWFAVHIGAFAALLYLQGWGTAIAAEAALMLLGWVMPIHYDFHLNRILKHAGAEGFSDSALLREAAVEAKAVRAVLKEAVAKKRNPQEWWASLVTDR